MLSRSGHRTLWHLLRPEEPNLLKYLKGAGYDVRLWGKNDLLAPGSWVASVTESDDLEGDCRPTPAFEPGEPGYYSFLGRPRREEEGLTHDRKCVNRAVEYLDAGPKGPFCLYLPLSFPHPTYGALNRFHDLIDPDGIPPLRPAELPDKPDFFRLIRRYRRLDEAPERLFRQVNAAYLAQIAEVDDLLGRLLAALERSGHAGDTTVIVFSDHGDWAGDYGLVEKWPSGMDDCLTRIPMIVRSPGGAVGHVVGQCIEAFDLMATVLELAGIEAGHTHFARSFAEQLRGRVGDPDRAVFCEGGYDPHEPHCFEGHPVRDGHMMTPVNLYYPKCKQQQDHPESVCRTAMIRTMGYKLIYRRNSRRELYDLTADPRELCNVYSHPEYEAVQRDLQERLFNWYLETSDVTQMEEDPRGRSDPR